MAIPKFYLEKRKDKDGNLIEMDIPILMFYSFGSGRLQYYTGQRVDSKNYVERYWIKGRSPIKLNAPNSTNINNALDLLANDVVDLHNKAKAKGIIPSVAYFRDGLDAIHKPKATLPEGETEDFISYFERVVSERKYGKRLVASGKNAGKPFREGGVKSLNTTLASLKRYTSASRIKRLPFEKVDKAFYASYRKFIFDVEQKEVSTFNGHIKNIKAVMNEAREDGLHDSRGHESKHFSKPEYETDSIAVPPEYLEKVEQVDLSEYPELDRDRDAFLVACYSALRFSDFSELEIEDVTNNFLRVKQSKTGDRVTIPVSKKLVSIIEKHNGSFPRASINQVFNRNIKTVFHKAGLHHKVKVRNTRGGVESFDMVPYYKLISSHTGRRTYATNMFKAGVPVMLIMAVTGHKTESSFLRYIRATNEDKARMMAEMMEKLGL